MGRSMTKRMILPLLFGITGCAILLWLGFWQVQRMEWKDNNLAEIEAKMTAPPVAIPANPNKADHNRMSVQVELLLSGDELHVLTSQKKGGPGFLVVTSGTDARSKRKILVDLGYIPEAEKEALRPSQQVRVLGNLLWPNETDGFTPDPNVDKNIWFARDIAKMSAALGTEPIMVVARDFMGNPTGIRPIKIGHDIPNDHKEYAITWFSLAFVWFGMTLYLLYRIRQKTV